MDDSSQNIVVLTNDLSNTVSIQMVEFVNGPVVAVELANNPLPAKTKKTTFPLFFQCPLTCLVLVAIAGTTTTMRMRCLTAITSVALRCKILLHS